MLLRNHSLNREDKKRNIEPINDKIIENHHNQVLNCMAKVTGTMRVQKSDFSVNVHKLRRASQNRGDSVTSSASVHRK